MNIRRLLLVFSAAVTLCGVMCVSASVSSAREIFFDGEQLRRVDLRFSSPHLHHNEEHRQVSPCAHVTLDSAIDVEPRRSAHPWIPVNAADRALLQLDANPAPVALRPASTVDSHQEEEAGESVAAAFARIGKLKRSTTSPFTKKPHVWLAVLEPTTTDRSHPRPITLAHAFDDPRLVRLHAGHHPASLDLQGRPIAKHHGILHRAWTAVFGGDDASGDEDKDMSTSDHHETHFGLESTTEAVWVPASTARVLLYCDGHNASISAPTVVLNLPPTTSKRDFAAKAAASDVEVRTLYAAGPPTKTFNIIFLSGGFRAEDKDMFFNNASNISALMVDPSLDPNADQDNDASLSDMHKTVPFNRYWMNWNVYAVFQPSLDAGASRPGIGLSLRNNLGCVHPAEIERAVHCDRTLGAALAAASPADIYGDPNRNVIVAIVNTHIYGGSAISIPNKLHMGNFFNGFNLRDMDMRQRMLSLTDHELGHAFGDLMDEYSIGVSEPVDRELSNCEYTPSGNVPTTLKWQHWIDIKNAAASTWRQVYGALIGSGKWDILDNPEPICGFTNYYKSNSNCMMHRLKDYFMCPVCRESASMAVLSVPFELQWPRKPLRDIVTVVAPASFFNGTTTAPSDKILTTSGEVVLHLGAHLTRGYQLSAVDIDGTPIPRVSDPDCRACFHLNSTNFAKYPLDRVVKINVTIVDTTDYFVVKPEFKTQLARQLTQHTYFRIMVASSANIAAMEVSKNMTLVAGRRDAVVGRHISDLQSAYQYCEADDPSLNETLVCSMNFPNRTYERPLDVAGLLADYDQWVLIGLAGLAVVFLFLWAYAATACKDKSNATARSIFKTQHSCLITLIRRVMILSSGIFLVAAVIAIAVSGYFYMSATALGKILLAAAVALAILLYFLAFFGFWTVMSRSKRMLVINGVLLFIAFAVLGFLFVVVVEIGKELQVESSFTIDMGDVSAQGALGANTTASSSGHASDQNGFWTNQLETLWIDTVQDDPGLACAIQGMLECSGFYTNCVSEFASTLTCPKNCEETNRKYQSPCQAKLKGYIVDNYVYIASATGSSAGLLVGGFFLNVLLLVLLCCQKKEVSKGNRDRIARQRGKTAAGGSSGGSAAAAAALPAGMQRQEDNRFHALYLLKSLDSSSTAALVKEFKRIDINGDNELDRNEMFVFFKKVLQYKPSAAELSAIFEVADTNKDGTIQLVEFLKLFGCKDTDEAVQLVQSVKNPRRAPRVPLPSLPLVRRKSTGGVQQPQQQQQQRQKQQQQSHAAPGEREEPLLAVPHAEVRVDDDEVRTQPTTATRGGAAGGKPSSPPVVVQQQGQQEQTKDPFADYEDLL